MTDSKDLRNHDHNIANTGKQTATAQNHSQTLIAQIYSPLPPPEMLASYERAQPGLIAKIIEMTEAESNHRRDLEKEKLLAEVSSLQSGDKLIARAQVYALILSMTALIMGCITAILGAQVAGSIIGITGLAGIIGAFLKNSKREK